MRKTRAVGITALVAASAMVMAACGGSTGQQGATNPPAVTSAAPGGGSASSSSSSAPASDTGSSSGSASDTGTASASGAGSGSASGSGSGSGSAMASSGGGAAGESGACGKPHGPFDAPASAAAGSVKVSLNEGMTSWNSASGHSNSVYNAYPLYLTQAQPFYYNDKLELLNNDSFVTCKIVSKDPLTISYTVNKSAKWSDGVPVTAADLLMAWAAQSGNYNTGAAETDDNGVLKKTDKIAFDSSSPGLALIKDFPEMTDDGLGMTVKYSEFFVDYPFQLAPGLPAHAVAMHALGETDAKKATADLVSALKNNLKDKKTDADKVKKIADFWNTGFDFTQLPSDKSLYLSDGAYLMTDFKKDQYLTFEANPEYTWGAKPSIKQITYSILPDAMASVQALANGEVDLINPQPTADVLGAVQKLSGQGIEAQTGDGGTYEHVDLAQNNKGPFDPAMYGGDKDKALKVRQAFLKTIPRQEILTKLVKPLNPNAEVRDSFNQVPGSPDYADTVAQNGSADWKNVDIEGAKKLLADAGVTNPKVRFMYAAKNVRRANEYKLIAASASQAGFQMVDGANPDWSSQIQNTKIYDAILFGWQNSAIGYSQVIPNFVTKGQNNFYGYSNPKVDADLKKLGAESDPAKQKVLNIDVEKTLFTDAFGTVLFQFPDVVGVNTKKIQGVKHMPIVPAYLWNYWEWTVPAS